MLKNSHTKTMAVAATVLITVAAIGGCNSEDQSGPMSNTQLPSSVSTPVPMSSVRVGDCLAGPEPLPNDEISVADCSIAGSYKVQQATTLGEKAPESRPKPQEVGNLAAAACSEALKTATGLTILVYPLEKWAGPQTPVICAVRNATN